MMEEIAKQKSEAERGVGGLFTRKSKRRSKSNGSESSATSGRDGKKPQYIPEYNPYETDKELGSFADDEPGSTTFGQLGELLKYLGGEQEEFVERSHCLLHQKTTLFYTRGLKYVLALQRALEKIIFDEKFQVAAPYHDNFIPLESTDAAPQNFLDSLLALQEESRELKENLR